MGNCMKYLNSLKTLIFSVLLIFIGSMSWCQNLIDSDTEIDKQININDTIDLQFVDWPSPGLFWILDSEYDTTLLSIKEKSHKLMQGYLPFGGKCIRTIQYKGKNKGKVNLEYTYGRPWRKEIMYICKIIITIK